MVGFNRRFAPITRRMADLLAGQPGPKAVTLTMNAGHIPADHWTQDREAGGGRIIGEACHFIDLARFLVGSPIVESSSTFLKAPTLDTASIQLAFEDGSLGTVHYVATGSRSFPKERVEVFASGQVLQLANFRTLTGFGHPSLKRERMRSQDKGHRAAVSAFIDGIRSGGTTPIPIDELMEVSRRVVEMATPVAGRRAEA
jgi:predicted dehydrogenase